MPFIFDYDTFYNYYTDPANLYIDDTPRPNVYFFTPLQIYTFALLNRRLYNPEIAKGDFSDIKGDLSVAK